MNGLLFLDDVLAASGRRQCACRTAKSGRAAATHPSSSERGKVFSCSFNTHTPHPRIARIISLTSGLFFSSYLLSLFGLFFFQRSPATTGLGWFWGVYWDRASFSHSNRISDSSDPDSFLSGFEAWETFRVQHTCDDRGHLSQASLLCSTSPYMRFLCYGPRTTSFYMTFGLYNYRRIMSLSLGTLSIMMLANQFKVTGKR